MAATESSENVLTEPCEACGTDTPHEARVEILQMGEGAGAKFSNEPYRISECTVCGDESTTPARCL